VASRAHTVKDNSHGEDDITSSAIAFAILRWSSLGPDLQSFSSVNIDHVTVEQALPNCFLSGPDHLKSISPLPFAHTFELVGDEL
jgi:hypothetical protein